MKTVAEELAQSLYENGVRTVFGLPGGEVVEILNAFREKGIAFVLVKNESSAIYMADVTARITGTIGVALTTLGPGATNAYVGIAHAYLDRSPVLLISAQTDPKLIGKHTHQVIYLQSCFRPVTKFSAELETETASETIHFALSQLKNGRPGPVHLGICDRVAKSNIQNIKQENKTSQTIELTPHIKTIQKILNKSTRPAIVVGLGLEPDCPYQELQTLAETIQAPVVDTPKAKGAIPATHPLFVGTVGLTTNDPAYEVLDHADCIIAVGFDVVELVKPWSQDAPLIWIAPWQNQDPYIPAVHEYVGETTPLLGSLTDGLDGTVDSVWGETYVKDFHTKLKKQPQPQAGDGCISPQDALRVIRNSTPENIIITTDVGSHKIFTALYWQAQHPNRYFVSNGLSTMGFGLPAAIAGSHVTQEPVICITGDAGLSMVIGELSLAIEMNLPVIIAMMNDNALDLIRTAQKRRDKPVFGTTFTNPNYALIAEGYGLDYHYVNNIATCERALQAALVAGKPCLLDIQIDPACYPTAVK
ncbi:MAG TPA: thiamine pyrophosphate-binding protein [Anaerolineales bacterium]|nr:thiamine pyrophosphate-binding protein [Anaerolineales bacterium]